MSVMDSIMNIGSFLRHLGITTEPRVPYPPINICKDFQRISDYNPQKAINFLCRFYHVVPMKIIIDNALPRDYLALYEYDRHPNAFLKEAEAYNLNTLLHEFYHHLTACFNIDQAEFLEEIQAETYATVFIIKMNGGD